MSEEEKEKHAENVTAAGVGRSSTPEEDLPPDLKAIEAELASLTPRTGRLDRERLIFLAGQQSVAAGDAGPAKRPGRWAWPAAFAAMTAVAVTLLLMLLLQPQAPGEVRFVEVPVQPSGNDGVEPDADFPSSPSDGQHVEPTPGRQEPFDAPAPGSRFLASVGLDWPLFTHRGQLGPATSTLRLLDRELGEGIDDRRPPASVAGPGSPSAPVPYRELLNSLLENPAPEKPLPDRPLMQILLYPGASS